MLLTVIALLCVCASAHVAHRRERKDHLIKFNGLGRFKHLATELCKTQGWDMADFQVDDFHHEYTHFSTKGMTKTEIIDKMCCDPKICNKKKTVADEVISHPLKEVYQEEWNFIAEHFPKLFDNLEPLKILLEFPSVVVSAPKHHWDERLWPVLAPQADQIWHALQERTRRV